MKRELEYFFAALRFFTRLPVPAWVRHSEDQLDHAARYFPLVGILIGCIGAGVTELAALALPLGVAVLPYCVFAHRSQEPGHRVQLAYLGVEPLMELDLRLGEGTGAALAFPLVQAAANFLNEMASFESAGVSAKS